MAGFEVVYMIFQGGDVCFESMDVLDGLYFFELGAVAFCNPEDVASERFGYDAKMTVDLFQLLGVHGSFVWMDLFKNATRISVSTTKIIAC